MYFLFLQCVCIKNRILRTHSLILYNILLIKSSLILLNRTHYYFLKNFYFSKHLPNRPPKAIVGDKHAKKIKIKEAIHWKWRASLKSLRQWGQRRLTSLISPPNSRPVRLIGSSGILSTSSFFCRAVQIHKNSLQITICVILVQIH